MKTKLFFFLPLLLWLTGSNVSAQPLPQVKQTQSQPTLSATGLPFQINMVETAEVKEQKAIANQAVTLLKAKGYDKLDALAAKYRSSKECYADGTWKLWFVYDALTPSVQASNAEWENRFTEITNWMLAKPDSIAAQVALANNWVAYAWKARGSGETNTVSREGWQLFGQRLIKALGVLKTAKYVKEKCPAYYSVLMRAALGLQAKRPQFTAIFNEAIRNELIGTL
jgi:hypothetical protein